MKHGETYILSSIHAVWWNLYNINYFAYNEAYLFSLLSALLLNSLGNMLSLLKIGTMRI
jgi:hypothetical protein